MIKKLKEIWRETVKRHRSEVIPSLINGLDQARKEA